MPMQSGRYRILAPSDWSSGSVPVEAARIWNCTDIDNGDNPGCSVGHFSVV